MSTSTLQNFIGDFYSRRLLLIHTTTATTTTTTLASPPPPAAVVSGDPYAGGDNTFDTNVVMVLSVLLCALICSLGLNSIIRCALRCSTLVSSRHGGAGAGANSGMKRKALKAFTTVSYSPEMKLPGLDVECVICLSEFAAGERVRLLPRCHHGFHVRCIDKWLSSHSSCPTCRDCLIETCQKIVGATATCSVPAASSSEIPPPLTAAPVVAQEAHVVNIILPLEPEGLIRNYHN